MSDACRPGDTPESKNFFDEYEDFQDFYRRLAEGKYRIGEVCIYHFDLGIIETLGAEFDEDRGGWYLWVENARTSPGSPGIPVYFEMPDDAFQAERLPMIVVERSSFTPARQRWRPGTRQYRVPSRDATRVTLPNGASGYTSYDERQSAVPYDFEYGVKIFARNEGRGGVINDGQRILHAVMRKYQPVCTILVRDTRSETSNFANPTVRQYQAFSEAVQHDPQIVQLGERLVSYTVRVRVQGELDLNPEYTKRAVSAEGSYDISLIDD